MPRSPFHLKDQKIHWWRNADRVAWSHLYCVMEQKARLCNLRCGWKQIITPPSWLRLLLLQRKARIRHFFCRSQDRVHTKWFSPFVKLWTFHVDLFSVLAYLYLNVSDLWFVANPIRDYHLDDKRLRRDDGKPTIRAPNSRVRGMNTHKIMPSWAFSLNN